MPPKGEGDSAHQFSLRVYYEDTDAGGVVYHANYLRFMERGRSEALAALGVDQGALLAGGTALVVRRIEVEYLGAARLFDQLVVTTRLEALGAARVILAQAVAREGAVLAAARVEIACTALARGRPVRWPSELRAALAALGAGSGA